MKPEKERGRRGRFVLASGLVLAVIALIVGIETYKSYRRDLPSLEQLHNIQPGLITRIYSADGHVLQEYFNQRRVLVPFNRFPKHLVDALLAVEDREFYDHWGVNLAAIVRAALVNVMTMSRSQGGSTLTQQLARNLFLTPEKTLARKIKEAMTAIEIEKNYSKDEILNMYLNQQYFGKGAYGIQSAAQTFFSKDVSGLSPSESALLIGLLKAPNFYSPVDHPERARGRRNVVLDAIVDYGKLSQRVADSLKALPLVVHPEEAPVRPGAYFSEAVRLYLVGKYGEGALYSSGLTVYTTLNYELQLEAERLVTDQLARLQADMESHHSLEDTNYTVEVLDTVDGEIVAAREYKQMQGALVAIDNKTGGVLAMVGGKDFKESKFNRAVQAKRQPGSGFKPFIYTTAIDNGFKPTDIIIDAPIVVPIGGEEWRPRNFDRTFRGPTSLRYGLAKSINLVTIKLLMDPRVTPQQVVFYAKKMGIKSELQPVPSLAIGTSEVTPLEMAAAFTTFPNGGIWTEPYLVTKILDRYGNVLEEREKPYQEEAISATTAYIMTNMMETVVNSGTGQLARKWGFERPAGGKTGTTDLSTDNWFTGFTPQMTTSVWVGYDDKTQIGEERGLTGAATALPIWTEFMKKAHFGLPVEDFVRPAGIIEATVCLESGLLARPDCPDQVTDLFTEATVPRDTCGLSHKGFSPESEEKSRFKIQENNDKKKIRF
jgi:penicillin-binding protein 1A